MFFGKKCLILFFTFIHQVVRTTSNKKKMGKGDKRTKKGKIILGSFGVSRPKKKKPTVPVKK